jgi:hypothetical protein
MEHGGELMGEKEAERELKDRKGGVKFQALVIPGVIVLAIVVSFIDPAKSMLCYLFIPVIMVVAGKFSSHMNQTS